MDYKLIALDIDGTLTNSRKEITPRTRYALLEAQAQGKKIILASGRHPIGVYPIARDLRLDLNGGYIMSFNGGKIIECATNRTIVTKLFPREYLADIVSVLKDSNITVITWDDRRIYADSKRNDYTDVEQDVLKTEMVVVDDFVSEIKFDINKILLAGEPDELDEYQKILAKRYDGLLEVYKSAPYFLELMPLGVWCRNGKRRARGAENRQLRLPIQRRGRSCRHFAKVCFEITGRISLRFVLP